MLIVAIHKLWRHFKTDSLFQNSMYLMMSTGTMAAFGFVFWLICSHLFSPSEIGIATTLISAMTLISYISLLGFNNTFVRFLPSSTERNNEINTGLTLSLSTAVIIAILYVLATPFIAPKLEILHQNIFYTLGFVAMVTLASINLLTDSIFIAYRAAKFNFFIDGLLMSSTKLFLPYFFVGLGAYGVFMASGAAAAIAMFASVFFLSLKFEYTPRPSIHWSSLKKVFHYSFANYIANLFNIAPILIIPLIVLNHLGAASAGYYYLAFAIVNLLYAVIYAVSQSLFAEGSYNEKEIGVHLKKSITVISSILVPGILILYFSAPIVLRVYGNGYSVAATDILQIFGLAAPAVAFYTITSQLLRVAKKVYSIIIVNIVYFSCVSIFTLLWVDRGLSWIGYSWLLGNVIAGGVGFLLLPKMRNGAYASVEK